MYTLIQAVLQPDGGKRAAEITAPLITDPFEQSALSKACAGGGIKLAENRVNSEHKPFTYRANYEK